jgi:2Fe-2S ferredoxin
MSFETVVSSNKMRHVPLVIVQPSGVAIQVEEGEDLMAAAQRAGYRWPTICHGQAECTVCFVVAEDPDAFCAPEPAELAGLELFAGRALYEGKVVRLACQARPCRDTTVTKRGVKPHC